MKAASVKSLWLIVVLLFPMVAIAQTAEEYIEQGKAKRAKGDQRGAVEDFNRALELSPDNPSALYNRGGARRILREYDGALSDYNRVIALFPKDSGAYNNRALVKKAMGDMEGAFADNTRAIELDPKDPKYLINRGNLKAEMRDLSGAIADHSRAIHADSSYAAAYSFRGDAKWQRDDLDGAIADYDKAIELSPGYPSDYYQRALFNLERGRLAEALRDHRKFCELSSFGQEFPRLYIWVIRARQGERAAADRELAEFFDQQLAAILFQAVDLFACRTAEYLLGRSSESSLLGAADSSDPALKRKQYCSALYFIGVNKLLAGDKTAAADYFQKCVAVERGNLAYIRLARAELNALGQ